MAVTLLRCPNCNAYIGSVDIKDSIAVPVLEPVAVDVLNTSVDELELSVRSQNVLKNEGIKTLGELVRWSEARLLRHPNFGRKSLREVNEELARFNLRLGMIDT